MSEGGKGRLIDVLIDRLELRRASIAEYQAFWCTECYRCLLHDPRVKGSAVLLCEGEADCRQPLEDGPISQCIVALRERALEPT